LQAQGLEELSSLTPGKNSTPVLLTSSP